MILGARSEAAADNDPRPVLIVTGLIQEARIAEGPGLTVICSSSDPKQLRRMMASFDATSIRGVISFGVAGGLDPSLRAGDVVIATEVVAGERRWASEVSLSDELLRSAGVGRQRVVRGGLVGAEQVVAARDAKAVLRRDTGAAAVDMESHIAADYAAAARLPFAALRVISDPANRSLPQVVSTAIKPNGDVDLAKVLRGLARHPTSIRSLVSTGIDFNRALRSLRGCRGFMLDAVLGRGSAGGLVAEA